MNIVNTQLLGCLFINDEMNDIIWDTRNAYKILVVKFEWNLGFGSPGCPLEDKSKMSREVQQD
jgi:hypothetical protein